MLRDPTASTLQLVDRRPAIESVAPRIRQYVHRADDSGASTRSSSLDDDVARERHPSRGDRHAAWMAGHRGNAGGSHPHHSVATASSGGAGGRDVRDCAGHPGGRRRNAVSGSSDPGRQHAAVTSTELLRVVDLERPDGSDVRRLTLPAPAFVSRGSIPAGHRMPAGSCRTAPLTARPTIETVRDRHRTTVQRGRYRDDEPRPANSCAINNRPHRWSPTGRGSPRSQSNRTRDRIGRLHDRAATTGSDVRNDETIRRHAGYRDARVVGPGTARSAIRPATRSRHRASGGSADRHRRRERPPAQCDLSDSGGLAIDLGPGTA